MKVRAWPQKFITKPINKPFFQSFKPGKPSPFKDHRPARENLIPPINKGGNPSTANFTPR